jgi:hypothetical protein
MLRLLSRFALGPLLGVSALAAHGEPLAELTDQQMADYALRQASLTPPRDGDVLGVLRGVTVRIYRTYSNFGRWDIVWLDPPPGKTCGDVGGVTRTRVIAGDFLSQSKMFCTLKAVADAEDCAGAQAIRRE